MVKELKTRGLHGVECVVLDDPPGEAGGPEALPEAVWHRCYVHFPADALDYLPRKADDYCRQELRWLYDDGISRSPAGPPGVAQALGAAVSEAH